MAMINFHMDVNIFSCGFRLCRWYKSWEIYSKTYQFTTCVYNFVNSPLYRRAVLRDRKCSRELALFRVYISTIFILETLVSLGWSPALRQAAIFFYSRLPKKRHRDVNELEKIAKLTGWADQETYVVLDDHIFSTTAIHLKKKTLLHRPTNAHVQSHVSSTLKLFLQI